MRRVAVTGGIAEGKSTVLEIVRQCGFTVASSDQIAAEVLEAADVRAEISLRLGLPADWQRADLRARVAENPEDRRALNRITHPRIRARMQASDATFHEVPLLFEACLVPLYTEIWVVTCGPAEQLRRLRERYGNEAGARLAQAQIASRAKVAFADRVIRTNSTLSSVETYVREIVQVEPD